jgi:hypothetical protein
MRTTIAAMSLLGLLSTNAFAAEPWEDEIATALGKAGTEMPGGVYRVGLPRTDLKVTLDGIELKPAFALGSWLAFKRHSGGSDVMVMGDLVLTDAEVNPVMERLVESGIEITALHNHLLRNTPHTMYMHVAGQGDPAKLATSLHDALAQSKTPFGGATPAAATEDLAELDTAAIDRTLGRKGKGSGGVYAISIPRAETPRDKGIEVPDAMGSAIAVNFQPTGGGRAAITGDFVLTGDEVNPVLSALRSNGIEVTALHNHMLADEPRLFFMHFWANDDTAKLAHGLRAAFDRVAVRKP